MDILGKFSVIKEHSDLLAIPFLAIAYYAYFPASLSDGNDIAWVYSINPSLGIVANLILSVVIAVITYCSIFAVASYFTVYHSIPMFPILGFLLLTLAIAPQFGIEDFLWVKPSLSFALGAVGVSLLSLGIQS